MRVNLKHAARAMIAAIVAAATLGGGVTTTAVAATMEGNPGYVFKDPSTGKSHALGLIAQWNYLGGKRAWCINGDEQMAAPQENAGVVDVSNGYNGKDANTMRQLAYIGDKYNASSVSDLDAAAAAYVIKNNLDTSAVWTRSKNNLTLTNGNASDVINRANQMWSEAVAQAPTITHAYADFDTNQGLKTGTVKIDVKNASNGFTAGWHYRAVLEGPAEFDSGGQEAQGTTGTQTINLNWHSTGNGTVTYKLYVNVPQAAVGNTTVSQQDQFLPKILEVQSPDTVTFKVIKDFQPTVGTVVAKKNNNRGSPITDNLTSGLAQGEWPAGHQVKVKAYLYESDTLSTFVGGLSVEHDGQSLDDYVNYVKRVKGLSPVATAETTFDGANQTKSITARKLDGSGDYTGQKTFHTWVVAVVKNGDEQITGDWISTLGLPDESAASLNPTSHDSTVLEQYSGMNRDILDTITIGNLPSDYGQWSGNSDYGFKADAKAKIRVWWAGSGTGVKSEDEKYKPTGSAEPTADANHKLIGEWEVPAANGVYKVGSGVIKFKGSGDSDYKTVASDDKLNIKATQPSETGYYVFIYELPESSRAQAFTSSYDDAWERTFVEQTETTRPELTTNVSAGEVDRGEQFHDTARISGIVSRGSYVVFDAWSPVSGTPDTSVSKLVDSQRVNITDAQADASAKTGSFTVDSMTVKTDKPGKVYWKASLYDQDGNLIDSHELGIENETVTVRGASITTKVSAEQVTVGETFHDVATVDGNVPRGSYVTFDAYNPVSGKPDANAGKLVDSQRVDITDAQADSGASFDVQSPETSTMTAGKVYWKATLHKADGTVLATHDLGVAGETVTVSPPTITTNVSQTNAGLGETFHDTATLTGGTLKAGWKVRFEAYNPVSGSPDTNAGKLVDANDVTITDAQAADSAKGRDVTVTSVDATVWNAGKVYWKASLLDQDGKVIATHELGLPSETVTVTGPKITTNVSNTQVGRDEQFHDSAVVEGFVPTGAKLTFTAYGPVASGNVNDVDQSRKLGETVHTITQTESTQSKTGAIQITSDNIASTYPGTVYWKATLTAENGTLLATHDLGIPSETVTVTGPKITTHVDKTSVALSETFTDTAEINGSFETGSTVTFTAYNPVDGKPDTNAGKLYEGVVTLTKEQSDKSKSGETVTVNAPDSTKADKAGHVYWQAILRDPKGVELARHELGLSDETTHVAQPTITTAVSKGEVSVGEEFFDVATIHGQVGRGWSVHFTAYEPVAGDPNENAGKLVDDKTVPISDTQADKSSSTDHFDVTGPTTSTDKTGAVYWKATLVDANGVEIATHRLGEESETVRVYGGGILSSHAQTMGATGEQLYDTITVYDESRTGTTSHEGNGQGNPTGQIGHVPAGSWVIVELYRQDGNNTASSNNLIGSVTHYVDDTAWKTVDGVRQQTFKVTDPKFTTQEAGMYYWVATLYGSDGSVLDKGEFGESGDQHGTGYESEERTPVQEYTTTSSKKWLSVNRDQYSSKTVSTYDMLQQIGYERRDGDVSALIGQTASNTEFRMEIWRQDTGSDASKDVRVWSGEDHDMPQLGADGTKMDDMQKLKSETVTIDKSWPAGTYYYRLLVTNPGVDWTKEDHTNVVKYTDRRVEAESFDLIDATTQSVEPLWLDSMHVADDVTLTGVIPEGTQYEVQIWKTDKHDGTAVENTGITTGRIDVPSNAVGDHRTTPVTFRTKALDNPGVGSWQFRVILWTPDNQGGDSSLNKDSVPLSDEWKQAPDQSAGYTERELLEDGVTVDSERFEVVKLSTDVTGTANMHTADGEHYVDATHPVQVNDKLTVDGYMLDGYTVGFDLYRRDAGDDPSRDQKVDSISPVALKEAQKTLDSAKLTVSQPGEYYWRWVFRKPDGTAFQPDGTNPAESDSRIPAESFHAVKVTTSTYKWSSKGGKTSDVARIEGTLPADATIVFEMHSWKDGSLLAKTDAKTLGELGFDTARSDQEITGPELAVPDAVDWYWVEKVTIPHDDQSNEFHVGDSKQPQESSRAIDATTDTAVERRLGDAVSDHADLTNVHWEQSGDIRDDLKTGLDVRWKLYQQSPDGDANSDDLRWTGEWKPLTSGVTEVDGDKVTPDSLGTYYWVIEIGDPSNDHRIVKSGAPRDPAETFRMISSESTADTLAAAGHELTDTVTIHGPVAEGTIVSWDVYFEANEARDSGEADDPDDLPAGWSLAGRFDTPSRGAHVITAEEAATAAKTGSVTVTSPMFERVEVGTYHWVHKLTSPTREQDGAPSKAKVEDQPFMVDRYTTVSESTPVVDVTTETGHEGHVGEPIHDTAIIQGVVPKGTSIGFALYRQADGDDSSKDEKIAETERVVLTGGETRVDSPTVTVDQPGTYYWVETVYAPKDHTGLDTGDVIVSQGNPRVPEESVDVVRVTTVANRVEALGTELRDRALIEGKVHDGQFIIFVLHRQSDGDDPSKDEIVKITDPVQLSEGQTEAVSPTVTPERTGTYYWTESIYPPEGDDHYPPCTPPTEDNHTPNTPPCVPPVHTENPRTPGETTDVVKVTTRAVPTAQAGDRVRDTALIEGVIPNGDYEITFEYWRRGDGGVDTDRLVATTDAVGVPVGASSVDSPDVGPSDAGEFYWRERLVERSTGRTVHYGDARLEGETTRVAELAQTGLSGRLVLAAAASAGVAAVLGVAASVRRRRGRRV